MIRVLMLSTGIVALNFAMPVGAQTTDVNVVREAVPAQKQIIVANSPEDSALREEIRKIRAYNAYVNSRVGISEPSGVRQKIELYATPTMQAPTGQTPQAPSVPSQMLQHTITEGDTLYSLARARCITVADIQSRNTLEGANIRLGQLITLPASQCAQTAMHSEISRKDYVRKVMPVPTSINIAETQNYAVLPKDSLYSIGKYYCLSAGELAKHNGIDADKAIQPGQILRLPRTACTK
ncbi:MAG: hypothetical protein COA69_13715 [Robiginitomaculum sp.]|nr:MAG: hypothetical protein COA69_13715 [Robiginitomaculum sp.]